MRNLYLDDLAKDGPLETFLNSYTIPLFSPSRVAKGRALALGAELDRLADLLTPDEAKGLNGMYDEIAHTVGSHAEIGDAGKSQCQRYQRSFHRGSSPTLFWGHGPKDVPLESVAARRVAGWLAYPGRYEIGMRMPQRDTPARSGFVMVATFATGYRRKAGFLPATSLTKVGVRGWLPWSRRRDAEGRATSRCCLMSCARGLPLENP
jgi:hypothetical protein